MSFKPKTPAPGGSGNRSITPIRKRTNATERVGVNYVRGIVDAANCVFREIDRAGDYGHDAFVLLVDDEAVTPVEIALQIKAGRSYCRARSCRFTVTPAHLGFWARYGLTTLGVVYDPDADCAWWIDLGEEARAHRTSIGNATVIFPKSAWNRFDAHGFEKVLIPTLLGEAPRIELATALEWARASDFDTHDVGIRVLLARYKEAAETWKAVFREFRRRGAESSFSVIKGLIRIMGHTDEGYYGDEVPWDIRSEYQARILRFGRREVSQLLSLVGDYGFDRGSVGWGLFAIIPPNPEGLRILAEVAAADDEHPEVRENAELMLRICRDDPQWWALWQPSCPPGGKSRVSN